MCTARPSVRPSVLFPMCHLVSANRVLSDFITIAVRSCLLKCECRADQLRVILLTGFNKFVFIHSWPISVKFGIGGLHLLSHNICYFHESLCGDSNTVLKDVSDDSCALLGCYSVIVCFATEASNNWIHVLFCTLLVMSEFYGVRKKFTKIYCWCKWGFMHALHIYCSNWLKSVRRKSTKCCPSAVPSSVQIHTVKLHSFLPQIRTKFWD